MKQWFETLSTDNFDNTMNNKDTKLNEKQIKEIIRQVFENPQVSNPPVSYKIADVCGEGYASEYIDMCDFELYVKRLKKQLDSRFTTL